MGQEHSGHHEGHHAMYHGGSHDRSSSWAPGDRKHAAASGVHAFDDGHRASGPATSVFVGGASGSTVRPPLREEAPGPGVGRAWAAPGHRPGSTPPRPNPLQSRAPPSPPLQVPAAQLQAPGPAFAMGVPGQLGQASWIGPPSPAPMPGAHMGLGVASHGLGINQLQGGSPLPATPLGLMQQDLGTPGLPPALWGSGGPGGSPPGAFSQFGVAPPAVGMRHTTRAGSLPPGFASPAGQHFSAMDSFAMASGSFPSGGSIASNAGTVRIEEVERLSQRVKEVLRRCSNKAGRARVVQHPDSERYQFAQQLSEAEDDFMRMGQEWRGIEEELKLVRETLISGGTLSPQAHMSLLNAMGRTGNGPVPHWASLPTFTPRTHYYPREEDSVLGDLAPSSFRRGPTSAAPQLRPTASPRRAETEASTGLQSSPSVASSCLESMAVQSTAATLETWPAELPRATSHHSAASSSTPGTQRHHNRSSSGGAASLPRPPANPAAEAGGGGVLSAILAAAASGSMLGSIQSPTEAILEASKAVEATRQENVRPSQSSAPSRPAGQTALGHHLGAPEAPEQQQQHLEESIEGQRRAGSVDRHLLEVEGRCTDLQQQMERLNFDRSNGKRHLEHHEHLPPPPREGSQILEVLTDDLLPAAAANAAMMASTGRGDICSCGNPLLADATFCRKCGRHRPHHSHSSESPLPDARGHQYHGSPHHYGVPSHNMHSHVQHHHQRSSHHGESPHDTPGHQHLRSPGHHGELSHDIYAKQQYHNWSPHHGEAIHDIHSHHRSPHNFGGVPYDSHSKQQHHHTSRHHVHSAHDANSNRHLESPRYQGEASHDKHSKNHHHRSALHGEPSQDSHSHHHLPPYPRGEASHDIHSNHLHQQSPYLEEVSHDVHSQRYRSTYNSEQPHLDHSHHQSTHDCEASHHLHSHRPKSLHHAQSTHGAAIREHSRPSRKHKTMPSNGLSGAVKAHEVHSKVGSAYDLPPADHRADSHRHANMRAEQRARAHTTLDPVGCY